MNESDEKYLSKFITIVPILAILPLIIGIFFKLGYLIPFDLKFLITSFSYSELALSSYSSVLFALISLYGYSLMKLHILDNVSWRLIFILNISFITVHYLPVFNMNFLDLIEKLILMNAFVFFNFRKDLITKFICIFLIVVVAPAINGFEKYYEFQSKASNIVVLKDDSTEWLLVEKISDTLILVDKKTIENKEYSFKFIDVKEVNSIESTLWRNLNSRK